MLSEASVAFSGEIGHRTITVADVVLFGGSTGDYARMHFDHGLAAGEPGRPAPIVHGLLSASWVLGALTAQAAERLAIGDPDASIAAYEVRLERSMRIGDRFALRYRPSSQSADPALDADSDLDTAFEVLNQRGERTARGTVSVRRGFVGTPPAAMARADGNRGTGPGTLYAEDLLEYGPRGESPGRTVCEADVVGFTNLTAERNPLYLNRIFSAGGRFGSPIVPPIWTFCLAFGDFLRDLLAAPLPATGLAGHVGDRFRCHAPVRIGDTLRTRHRPLRVTPSRSQPRMSVVHFALQLLDERDTVVQDGEVAMFVPNRGGQG
ncbi:MAG: MaoC/PaaZ C-terminal domain-containing protein [Myxococcota bacterium]